MLLFKLLVLLSLQAAKVLAIPCVVMDAYFNLLAFGGSNGKDYSAGTRDNWKNGKATDITSDGRPPFDASNTVCYLSQFQNAIYVRNADKSRPYDISIYDVDRKSWSTQKTTSSGSSQAPFSPTAVYSILDHDTNVFFGLSGKDLWQLEMGELTKSDGTIRQWTAVNPSPYGESYISNGPVMALAQNHIHFLDVPANPVGSASIFVIHYAYFQPAAQSYPLSNGGKMPTNKHGQAFSMFLDNMVQKEFGFVPDDGSATYVVNVNKNTTQTLAGPPNKDSQATYFGGPSSIVQLGSDGIISYLPYTPDNTGANSEATWATLSAIPKLAANSISASSSSVSRSASLSEVTSASYTDSARASVPSNSQSNSAAPALHAVKLLTPCVALSVIAIIISSNWL